MIDSLHPVYGVVPAPPETSGRYRDGDRPLNSGDIPLDNGESGCLTGINWQATRNSAIRSSASFLIALSISSYRVRRLVRPSSTCCTGSWSCSVTLHQEQERCQPLASPARNSPKQSSQFSAGVITLRSIVIIAMSTDCLFLRSAKKKLTLALPMYILTRFMSRTIAMAAMPFDNNLGNNSTMRLTSSRNDVRW
jgi:hypothetical protein